MKVWVAVGSWSYEGNDDPMGVYSTKEAAEEAIRKLEMADCYRYDGTKVIEYELDG